MYVIFVPSTVTGLQLWKLKDLYTRAIELNNHERYAIMGRIVQYKFSRLYDMLYMAPDSIEKLGLEFLTEPAAVSKQNM